MEILKEQEDAALAAFAARFITALEARFDGNRSALARELGCSAQAVQFWTAGKQYPNMVMLLNVAAALRVTPQWLLFGDAQFTPAPVEPDTQLAFIRHDEAALLTDYRLSTESGKRQMRASGKSSEKLPASALPAQLTSNQS